MDFLHSLPLLALQLKAVNPENCSVIVFATRCTYNLFYNNESIVFFLGAVFLELIAMLVSNTPVSLHLSHAALCKINTWFPRAFRGQTGLPERPMDSRKKCLFSLDNFAWAY